MGALRSALIARDIRELNKAANIWLAELAKCPLGTLVAHIGGLFLPNASMGTISRAKRARALHACRGMIEGSLDCEAFESAQGLLGHVVEMLALDMSLLGGLGRQRRFAFEHHLKAVALTSDTSEAVAELERLIATTPSATIFSALTAASTPLPPGREPAPAIIISSDACTGSHDEATCAVVDERGARDPGIFAHAGGLFFRYPLRGPWRLVHITVTEALGPALAALVLAPRFPHSPILVQGDASAALAFLKGRSDSECLRRIYRLWRSFAGVSEFIERASAEHVSGVGNTIDDAGSRAHWDVLFRYTAALGVRLEEIPLTADALRFLDGALAIALAFHGGAS